MNRFALLLLFAMTQIAHAKESCTDNRRIKKADWCQLQQDTISYFFESNNNELLISAYGIDPYQTNTAVRFRDFATFPKSVPFGDRLVQRTKTLNWDLGHLANEKLSKVDLKSRFELHNRVPMPPAFNRSHGPWHSLELQEDDYTRMLGNIDVIAGYSFDRDKQEHSYFKIYSTEKKKVTAAFLWVANKSGEVSGGLSTIECIYGKTGVRFLKRGFWLSKLKVDRAFSQKVWTAGNTPAKCRWREDYMKFSCQSGPGLLMYAQPQFSLHTGEVTDIELLVRYRDSLGNIHSPGYFLEAIRNSSAKSEFVRWTIDQSFWVSKHVLLPAEFSGRVSVNLDGEDITARTASYFASQMDKNPDSRIEVELTEYATCTFDNEFRAALSTLRNNGVTLSIDDYGTGYNHLKTLLELDFEKIKIDRCILRAPQKYSHAALAGLYCMSNHLNIPMVVEGVESQEDVHLLDKAGIELVQGYHYAKPMPLTTLKTLLIKKESYCEET